MADRLTGKASAFSFGGALFAITKATPKITRKLADTTDSGDYNSTNDMIYPTQLPVSAAVELSIEGRYRKSSVPSGIVATLFTGVFAVPVQLALDAGSLFGHGNFDISDFQADIPVEDTVTFTCTMKSAGQFTPNS